MPKLATGLLAAMTAAFGWLGIFALHMNRMDFFWEDVAVSTFLFAVTVATKE